MLVDSTESNVRRKINKMLTTDGKFERILTMVHGVQDWNAYGLYPSSGFFYRTRRFGDWLCLRPQVDVAE
jgi:hypothetical protein